MICHNCKNEKWEKEVCPNCGMNEKDAFLAIARRLQQESKYFQAVEFIEKHLRISPENLEALHMKAVCLCQEAVKNLNLENYKKAQNAIELILEKDWFWEEGHQRRVNLFIRYGFTDLLVKEYQKSSLVSIRAPLAEEMLKIIRLAQEFNQLLPPASPAFANGFDGDLLLKKLKPWIFGSVFLVTTTLLLPLFFSPKEEGEGLPFPLLLLAIFIFISFLIGSGIIIFRVFKKNKKRQGFDETS